MIKRAAPIAFDRITFVAIERHSKLVLNIAIGKRDQRTTDVFIEGVRHATTNAPFQVTTDGFAPYRSAITTTLHDRLTGFAQLIKVYRTPRTARSDIHPPKSHPWRWSQFTDSLILIASALQSSSARI